MTKKPARKHVLFLVVVFFIALSGLAYELVAGTAATYLLGQSITQFSFAMGWFLAAMGFGAYLSRNTRSRLREIFLNIQIVLSLVGGFSALIMFIAFSLTDALYPVFMLIALVVGTAIGFEIPLLLRLVSRMESLKLAVSDILTWDYLGALVSSILFPLFFLPMFGLVRSGILFGALNLIAGWMIWLTFNNRKRKKYILRLIAVSFILFVGFIGAERLTSIAESSYYQDPIVYAENTKFQRIVITKWRRDIRLYLDGELQFSTRDEVRYHESLIHVPILSLEKIPQNVLILGGGDGIAARELLKYSEINKITIVDLDEAMTRLFREREELSSINHHSLSDSRVEVINQDAFLWLKLLPVQKKFDLIVVDLPDPNNHSLGKLYTKTFYSFLIRHLLNGGAIVVQATSPVFAGEAFRMIQSTISSVFSEVYGIHTVVMPYHIYIPSFGDWGFVLAGKNLKKPEQFLRLQAETKFLDIETARSLFIFPRDIKPETKEVNTLNSQKLVDLYEQAWKDWFQ